MVAFSKVFWKADDVSCEKSLHICYNSDSLTIFIGSLPKKRQSSKFDIGMQEISANLEVFTKITGVTILAVLQ